MTDEYVYVIRYWSYYCENTVINGIYRTWAEAAAEIVDSYDGYFDYQELREPEPDKYSNSGWDRRIIDLKMHGGDELIIEKVKVG